MMMKRVRSFLGYNEIYRVLPICDGVCEYRKGAVTDKSQPRHKKYTQFYREEGVFFGIIYV